MDAENDDTGEELIREGEQEQDGPELVIPAAVPRAPVAPDAQPPPKPPQAWRPKSAPKLAPKNQPSIVAIFGEKQAPAAAARAPPSSSSTGQGVRCSPPSSFSSSCMNTTYFASPLTK